MAWQAWLLAVLCIGLSVPARGTAEQVAAVNRKVAGVERALRSGRNVFDGTITEVTLARPRSGRALQGIVRVEAAGGAQKLFRVQTFTLVLVRDRDGRLWAGRLTDLRRGWACSVAFDLHDGPDDGGGDKDADGAADADHLIAQAP